MDYAMVKDSQKSGLKFSVQFTVTDLLNYTVSIQ